MKKMKQNWLLALLTLATTFSIQAQDLKYWILADQVKPAMEAEYVQANKDLIAACKKHNFQNLTWTANRADDGVYNYISTIENMGDLDKKYFEPLEEKMGKENMQLLWDKFDKCVDKSKSYIITLKKELSYMPNGLTAQTDTDRYRKHHYFFVAPSNLKTVTEKIKAITALYTKKNSKVNYRVYKSGFGSNEDYFLVSISAKNEEEYAKIMEENRILLGAEGKTL